MILEATGHSLSESRVREQWSLLRMILSARRHAAMIRRQVLGGLKWLEGQLVDAGLMPEPSDDFKAASSARVRSKQPVEAVSGRPVMGQCRLVRLGMERREARTPCRPDTLGGAWTGKTFPASK